jgi:hypothetical protein
VGPVTCSRFLIGGWYAVVEDTMEQSDAVATGEACGLLYRAAVDLSTIVATVDRVGEMSDPTFELLEASRALHNALVFLSDWSGDQGDDKGVR